MPYQVIRKYFDETAPKGQVIMSGLTLEQAQAHCKSPETSSRTCTSKAGKDRTALFGPWFDAYEEE